MIQKTALSILQLGHTTFLTGAAGAGKSYVLREYITYLKKHGIKYAVTASTGIASTHINGTTIHSWTGIGIKQRITPYDMDALEENQALYKRWNDTNVLIIDEVSMLHASFVDMIDAIAKHMRRSEKPFGGMQIVFAGDFFQLPPVVKNTDSYENTSVFAFTSRSWREAKPVICYLTEQFRQDDDSLSSILNAIRSGDVEDGHYEMLQEKTQIPHTGDYIKLYTHNENVDVINEAEFNKMKGEVRTYEMISKGKAKLVASLKNNCLAAETLRLKIGAKVICIKNSPDRSYVNGSMGQVAAFDNEGSPVIALVNGRKVTIKADSWKIEEDGKIKAELQQLPIKLAWAITVHKSQGMTLDRAEIDLSRAFAPGQGYVALSRLTSLDGLYLKGFNSQALMMSDLVKDADATFRKRSEQAEDAINKYDEATLLSLSEKFLQEKGGSIAVIDLDEEDDDMEVKILSHITTKEMLSEGKTLLEIAEVRGFSVDTIIGHIEKLVDQKETISFEKILPKKTVVTTIKKAFESEDTHKLTPVYDFLKGKVSYHDIRVTRAYLKSTA